MVNSDKENFNEEEIEFEMKRSITGVLQWKTLKRVGSLMDIYGCIVLFANMK